MVRFVCLKMHSGRSVGKGLEAEKLAAGRLAPQGSTHVQKKERENAVLGFPVFFLSSWRKAGLSVFISLRGYCLVAASEQGFSLLLPRRRTLEPLEFHRARLVSKSTRVTQTSWSICSESVPEKSPLSCARLPGPQQVCLAQRCFQTPLSLLCRHLTLEISYS